MVKEFLSERGIRFVERDVSRDRNAAQELVGISGQMGVPVTVIGGQTVIGFDRAKLEQAVKTSQSPSFGLSVADAAKITARQGSRIMSGGYIGKVRSSSLAERTGLRPGDIITELNGQTIDSVADFERVISRLSRGSHFSVVYWRGNQKLTGEGTFN